MKKKRPSLSGWLRKPPASSKKAPSKEVEALLSDLQEEQTRLSAELERTLRSYDLKTRIISKRLAEMVNNGGSKKALEMLREEQEDLWRVVRRIQSAGRSNRQLEAELREWMSRPEPAVRSAHPDHPKARVEIVASELRIRGREPAFPSESATASSYEGSARDVDPLSEVQELAEMMELEPEPIEEVQDQPAASQEEAIAHIPLRHGSEEIVLCSEIESCIRELRRTLAHEDAASLTRELAEIAGDLKRHHAQLRRIDRGSGRRRYRMGIGLS